MRMTLVRKSKLSPECTMHNTMADPDLIARQQEALLRASTERFNEGVANILLNLEELRHLTISNDQHDKLELILQQLGHLERWAQDAIAVDAQTTTEMHHHVLQRVVDAARTVFTNSISSDDNKEPSGDAARREWQGRVARMAELNLIFCDILNKKTKTGTKINDIINAYTEYQRQTLRNRAKPVIADLVTQRRNGTFDHTTKQRQNNALPLLDDNDDEPSSRQFHGTALATILGEAGALIHPLAVWKSQLAFEHPIERAIDELCTSSITKLDETAELLTKTVSDWFFEDRPINDWMIKANDMEISIDSDELEVLDGIVEEMAICCQVMKGYLRLVASVQETTGLAIATLLPEWTLKYSSLEGFWALQNWKTALREAVPVTIVLGTDIRVPSVVEDAHYLSTRALQRAARTSAVSTVANLISHDVWSPESETTSVYKALQDGLGCWQEPKATSPATTSSPSKAPSSGNFAASLASALDEDLSPTKTPPSSGNFLVSLVNKEQIQQRDLETTFCLLNGIHAAEGAAHALSSFLESLDSDEINEKEMSLIQLLQEELTRYAGSYETLLSEHIDSALDKWCGSQTWKEASGKGCFSDLRRFLESESYRLDEEGFLAAETDERLESTLLKAFTGSKFVHEIREKCELHVRQIASERIAKTTVDVVMETLWNTKKMFNDWGSLLLSKQARTLQDYISYTIVQATDDSSPFHVSPEMLAIWQRLCDCVTVLQLEKPSDWLIYSSSNLSSKELTKTMSLRVDFSKDAIDSVVSSINCHSSS